MADVSNSMVHGVGPVLQALKQLEPTLYKEIEKEIKTISKPLRDKVAAGYPNSPWESTNGVQWTKYGRTTRGRSSSGAQFPRYNGNKARKGVTVVVGGRKVRRTNSYPIMRLRQADAGGQIYDLSKNNQTANKMSFVDNLNKQGEPSRVMWKRTREFLPLIEKKLGKIIDGVGSQFTTEIARMTEQRNRQSAQARSQVRNALGQFGKAIR